MDHADHVALLRAGLDGVAAGEGWADIGAGGGAFTLALADLLGPGASVIAVDRDAGALRANARAIAARFPSVGFEALVADFDGPLELDGLDGIVAANSLHFVSSDRQVDCVRRLATLVRPGGRFLVVEYDADRGNRGFRTRSASRRGRDLRRMRDCGRRRRSGASRAGSSVRSIRRSAASRPAARSCRRRPGSTAPFRPVAASEPRAPRRPATWPCRRSRAHRPPQR